MQGLEAEEQTPSFMLLHTKLGRAAEGQTPLQSKAPGQGGRVKQPLLDFRVQRKQTLLDSKA